MIETIGRANNDRAKFDFYSTDPKAVNKLVERENLKGLVILENSIGNGHIAKVLKENNNTVYGVDIIKRNYPVHKVHNFLTLNLDKEFDCAVYNPPFKLITEFILHSFKFTNVQYVFARIQLLETIGRYERLYKYKWLEKVMVFSSRMATAKNGDDALFGKNSSMCFCWFKFNKRNKKKPVIEWI